MTIEHAIHGPLTGYDLKKTLDLGRNRQLQVDHGKWRDCMTQTDNIARYHHFVALGTSAKPADVDFLMTVLAEQDDFATSRLVDFALSLVDTREGKQRLRHYLFHGEQRQRNYAALYFKRKGYTDLLDEAVAMGKIDHIQAYAR